MEVEKKIAYSKELINQLSNLISSQIGIYFPPDQIKGLERKLISAMPELGYKDIQECLEGLIQQKQFTKTQLEVLSKHLTIGETYFFRDKNMFAMLKDVILPDIKAKHQNTDRTIRIWSAACATGEEAYSLAILISELIPPKERWNIRIFATDLNPSFIKKGKEGRYKSWSFRSMPEKTYEHYFSRQRKGELLVVPSIRSMVQFAPLNLIEGAYCQSIPELKNLDLILCNNVLIYFSLMQIKATIGYLTNALAKDAWLVVSSVEVPFVNDPHLLPVAGHKTTVFKKSLSIPKKVEKIKEIVVRAPVKPKEIPIPESKPVTKEEFYECCLSMYRSGLYKEVIHQLTQGLTPHKHQTYPLKKRLREVKLLIHSLANLGKFDLAKNWCEAALKADRLDKELHYLHAAIMQELNENDKALSSLRASLYLDPDMVASRFLSGMLLLKQNDLNAAKKQMQNTLSLIEKMQDAELIPCMENITAAELKTVITGLAKEKGWEEENGK